jgi:hypothetical protein
MGIVLLFENIYISYLITHAMVQAYDEKHYWFMFIAPVLPLLTMFVFLPRTIQVSGLQVQSVQY